MAAGRTAAEHYAQAQRNEAFYTAIGGCASSHPEWAVPTLFYTAVHELEAALLALLQPSPKNHQARKTAMRRHFSRGAAAFEQLYAMSVAARYECEQHSQADIAHAENLLDLVRQAIADRAGPPY